MPSLNIGDRLKFYGAAALFVISLVGLLLTLAQVSHWKRTAKHAEAQVTEVSGQLHACQANLQALDNAREVQNAAIDQMRRDGEARTKRAEEALKRAEADARRYRDRAAKIAARKPGPDQCLSAREIIVDTLREERQ